MKGDFIGFSFDGIHSSTLGIIRVSDGDWYNEQLQSDFEDRQTFVTGRDGEYYFGSDYKARIIKISIAFDSVTEKQFRLINHVFSTKKICSLIFDERPYKKYMGKLASPIELSYVCFDEPIYEEEIQAGAGIKGRDIVRKTDTGRTKRIYKGEGEIEFVCTNPFASAPYKTLDEYETQGTQIGDFITYYTNIDEWAEASGILTRDEYDLRQLDRFQSADEGATIVTNVYNPGDIASPFYLYLPFNNGSIKGKSTDQFYIRLGNEVMILDTINKKGNDDTGIIINTSNHLIEGVVFSSPNDGWKTTGNLYNDCIISGDFPKIIPVWYGEFIFNELTGDSDTTNKQQLKMNCDVDIDNVRLSYKYLYY